MHVILFQSAYFCKYCVSHNRLEAKELSLYGLPIFK